VVPVKRRIFISSMSPDHPAFPKGVARKKEIVYCELTEKELLLIGF